jgi:folylpolyglutamate synthase/dihydropteroate synthase
MERASYKLGFFDIDIKDRLDEAISINQKSISTFELADIIKLVLSTYKRRYPGVEPYFDEVIFVSMAYYFSVSECDLVLIKKPLDAASSLFSSVTSALTVVTPITFTLPENIIIDSIVKKGSLEIVSSPQHKSIHGLISDACATSGCRFTIPVYSETSVAKFSLFKTSFTYMGKEYSIRSFSPSQIINAITAIEAARALGRIGLKISDDHIEKGILDACFSGRCEVLSIKPNIIISSEYDNNAIDSIASSLAQIKDQLDGELTVCVDDSSNIDEAYLSHKLSSCDICFNGITKIHYEYAERKAFDCQIEDILSGYTCSDQCRTGSIIFIGGRDLIDRARLVITHYLSNT